MKHTEEELTDIKKSISEMWSLVQSQFENAKNALLSANTELAEVVLSREKRVNAFELKIDSDCENYIALYSPVAIDLRLVLSIIKINKTLERIGDFADAIARFVVEWNDQVADKALLELLKIENMMGCVEKMLEITHNALTDENTTTAGIVFSTDRIIDARYNEALALLAPYINEHPDKTLYCLYLTTVLRKIERAGDHCNNIMEEIVFYLDAKVLKHSPKD